MLSNAHNVEPVATSHPYVGGIRSLILENSTITAVLALDLVNASGTIGKRTASTAGSIILEAAAGSRARVEDGTEFSTGPRCSRGLHQLNGVPGGY